MRITSTPRPLSRRPALLNHYSRPSASSASSLPHREKTIDLCESMPRATCYTSLAVCLALELSSALMPSVMIPANSIYSPLDLSALPNSSAASFGARDVPSKTARESAFNVEWEPMTELERRVEDGVNYEHTASQEYFFQKKAQRTSDDQEEGIPRAKGVFVGYRYTQEEYERIRSADPKQ